MLAFCMQAGGGLIVFGTATLTNTNVYSNQAGVRAHLPLHRPFLHRPAGTLRGVLAFLSQSGAGLYIDGVANLNGCQVYENVAQNVRDRPRPLPRTFLQRPAGTFRVLAFSMQSGAGLIVRGTASLTNTNVYENVATIVRLHFEPS